MISILSSALKVWFGSVLWIATDDECWGTFTLVGTLTAKRYSLHVARTWGENTLIYFLSQSGSTNCSTEKNSTARPPPTPIKTTNHLCGSSEWLGSRAKHSDAADISALMNDDGACLYEILWAGWRVRLRSDSSMVPSSTRSTGASLHLGRN